MHNIEYLKKRLSFQQASEDKAVEEILSNSDKKSFYIGFDPTAPSLHAGSLFGIIVAKRLAKMGLTPIIVLGGGTGMIGDPSGKTEARPLLTDKDLAYNVSKIKEQIEKILPAEPKPIFLNNLDWIKNLNLVEFLRDIGRHFSVNRMLTQESVKQRMEKGISYLEFTYMIIQAYDFAHLNKNNNCVLQVGGTDQWGNMVMGIDLSRRLNSKKVECFTFPLVATSDGSKMGKTAKGAVWLAPERTSPYEFYQYFLNVSDDDVEKFLYMFTDLDDEKIKSLTAEGGAALKEAKQTLAYELTKIVHGVDEAEKSKTSSLALFSQNKNIDDIKNLKGVPEFTISTIELSQKLLLDILAESKIIPSKSEARRLIQGNAISILDKKITDMAYKLSIEQFENDLLLIKIGKKRYLKLILSN